MTSNLIAQAVENPLLLKSTQVLARLHCTLQYTMEYLLLCNAISVSLSELLLSGVCKVIAEITGLSSVGRTRIRVLCFTE